MTRRLPRIRAQAAAVVALAAACAAIAGVASGGSPWESGSGSGRALPAAVVQALAVVLGIALGGSLLWAWRATPTATQVRKRRRALRAGDLEGIGGDVWAGVRTAAVVVAAVCLLALALLGVVRRGNEGTRPGLYTPAGRHRQAHTRAAAARHAAAPSLGTWFVAGLGGVLVVFVAPLALLRRRRGRGAPATAETLVAQTVREAIDDLEREPDARRAIVRAYVRMTEACAAADLTRHVDETPSEFLPRVLRALSVSAASARRLTSLFEEARFGGGSVGRSMQADAVAALREVCRELEA